MTGGRKGQKTCGFSTGRDTKDSNQGHLQLSKTQKISDEGCCWKKGEEDYKKNWPRVVKGENFRKK